MKYVIGQVKELYCLCLLPHGRSGLKCLEPIKSCDLPRLLPHGRSGLKYLLQITKKTFLSSPSAWKEWIEMDILLYLIRFTKSLLPHGRSGLKCTTSLAYRGAGLSPSAWKERIEIGTPAVLLQDR